MVKDISAIDIVLLWVDGNDPVWQSDKKYYGNSSMQGTTSNRFRDWGTLRFVFRSISTTIPWIRKVHFVTEGHLPEWINKDCPKLNIVKHSDFFCKDSKLPTFNSNAIDFNICNIPDLSERFILFNDDTFVLNPLTIDRFFVNNLPVDNLSFSFNRSNLFYRLLRNNVNASMLQNNITVINEKYSMANFKNCRFIDSEYGLEANLKNIFFKLISFGKVPWINIYHHPQPHLKSTLYLVDKIFSNKVLQTKQSRFRTSEDITIYLCRFWNLLNGLFVSRRYNDHISLSISKRNSLDYLDRLPKNTNFLCICDDVEFNDEDFFYLKNCLYSYLENKFPNKSEYEK